MKGWKRLLVLTLALVLINGATWVVVVENQHNGVYPIDGDSIGIPIISTLVASSFVLPLLVLIGLLPGAQFLSRLCSRGQAWTVCVNLLLFALYVAAALFAIGGAGYWAIPNHYWITVCYFVLLLALVLFFALDARRLLSNFSNTGRAEARR
jgi:hypothetical protein